MSKKKIKPWMLTYSIIFLFFTVIFVVDNIKSAYHILYIIWSIIIYLLANSGNVLYSFSYSSDITRKYWRLIAPIIVIDFVSAGMIDYYFSQGAGKVSPIQNIIIWSIGFAVFFPTFRANFILGYKKKI